MLYIRKLFTQDLRDGKQIAFPKEPSYSFFSFDYLNNERDRQISFTFRASFGQFNNFDGKRIVTRIYTANSESRMDGEVKAFIRDQLNAQVGDLLIMKNKGTRFVDFEFMFIPQSNEIYYPIFLALSSGDNHTVCNFQERLPIDKELQKIYFGTPGSGKSWKVENEVLPSNDNLIFRTTFHPDTDYSSFVGCYKPHMKNSKIEYEFTPQIFTEAYVAAWNGLEKKESYYLVIEEINRGNCAQIFGDLFQLLDRDKKTGFSEYPIKADNDLREYLERTGDDEVLTNKEGIKGGKLRLPPNLIIIATMNTSDQSLFPMDSAFKRRWSWEFVPIKYDEPKSAAFIIKIPSSPFDKWVDFLKKINGIILEKTDSEDKQMGSFFIKGDIDEKEFKDKVMFYLWSEVCKDCFHTNDNFFRTKDREFSYNELYGDKGHDLLIGFFDYIKEYNLKEDQKE